MSLAVYTHKAGPQRHDTHFTPARHGLNYSLAHRLAYGHSDPSIATLKGHPVTAVPEMLPPGAVVVTGASYPEPD